MNRRQLMAGLAGGVAFAQVQPVKTHLKAGDAAPDFELASTDGGKKYKLSDFKGKQTVVLAFFPAAFTGG